MRKRRLAERPVLGRGSVGRAPTRSRREPVGLDPALYDSRPDKKVSANTSALASAAATVRQRPPFAASYKRANNRTGARTAGEMCGRADLRLPVGLTPNSLRPFSGIVEAKRARCDAVVSFRVLSEPGSDGSG
jgi:hypothetical protein